MDKFVRAKCRFVPRQDYFGASFTDFKIFRL